MILNKDEVFSLFDKFQTQGEVLIEIYKMVFNDFDSIEKVDGRPSISKNTWLAISHKFISFDRIYHPNCMAGGLWMNSGFSGDDDLPDWTVDISRVRIVYKTSKIIYEDSEEK
jgi:hypothetical protein